MRVLREHRCACVHSVHAIDSEHQRTYGRASSPARAYDIQPRVAYSTRLRSEKPTPYEQLLQVVLRVHRREVVQPRERMCKAQVVAALHPTKRQKPAARPTLRRAACCAVPEAYCACMGATHRAVRHSRKR